VPGVERWEAGHSEPGQRLADDPQAEEPGERPQGQLPVHDLNIGSRALISHLAVFPYQALIRMQPLPPLPESLGVGRDPGPKILQTK
jgi:hypothetical protein